MSQITESEIKTMTKEQNYMRGYADGKSDVLDKIRAEIEARLCDVVSDYTDGYRTAIQGVLAIIDKYMYGGAE